MDGECEARTQVIMHILGGISELKCLNDVFWTPRLALGLGGNLYFDALDLRIVISITLNMGVLK